MILVSVSPRSPQWPEGSGAPSNLEIRLRENGGHTFASYRAGILALGGVADYDQLLLVRDSFYVLENFALAPLLKSSEEFDLYSLSSANQPNFHLQSYFLVFNGRALRAPWFQKFFEVIYPVRDEIQDALLHEVGLSRAARDAGMRLGAALGPSEFRLRSQGILAKIWGRPPTSNTSHVEWRRLRREFGVLNVDLVRKGSLRNVFKTLASADSARVAAHIARLRPFEDLKPPGRSLPSSDEGFDFELRPLGNARIAVVLHLFFLDLAVPIRSYLDRIAEPYDLFVTIPSAIFLPLVHEAFGNSCAALRILVCENRGRDIRPFLEVLGHSRFDGYACLLKIHSKKSSYSMKGTEWRDQLLGGLLPNSETVARLVGQFAQGENLGVMAPRETFVSDPVHWGGDRPALEKIWKLLDRDPQQIRLFFVAGSMFWISPKALEGIASRWRDFAFEKEAGQRDGTLAHAFERFFCIYALSRNLRCVDMEGKDVDDEDARKNRVLVL